MRILFICLLLALAPGMLFSQNGGEAIEESPPGDIPREDLPLAVIWGLSIYGGASIPYSPDPFAEFWQPGFSLTLDMDILLRNDIVLGLSYSYSNLRFDAQEFWRQRGINDSGDLGREFDIPINNLLISYRGIENYILPSYKPTYELGGGFYHIQNTDLDLIYTSDYDYILSPRDRIEAGLFGGMGIAWLLTDTLQMSVKGRYHYVFKVSQHHQYFDVRLGFSLL